MPTNISSYTYSIYLFYSLAIQPSSVLCELMTLQILLMHCYIDSFTLERVFHTFPTSCCTSCGLAHTILAGYEQQDAHEFSIAVLDVLHQQYAGLHLGGAGGGIHPLTYPCCP